MLRHSRDESYVQLIRDHELNQERECSTLDTLRSEIARLRVFLHPVDELTRREVDQTFFRLQGVDRVDEVSHRSEVLDDRPC